MERIIVVFFAAWLVVMGAGILIALLPLILYVVGFVLMFALLVMVGRLIGSCFIC